ncbi:hypothetical protein GCM10022420_070870 [Streptomyces iranensis]|uniref:RNA polymerase sigma factor 70 region 4 type 2 domain-containing protein n=1 Tax=Streptomyces iranensis TaxID=576784 RepID=A0A060ZW25_9ACTN|nr:predicted protein [Streptomyces iranensis]
MQLGPDGSVPLDPRDPLGLKREDGRERYERCHRLLFGHLARYDLPYVDRDAIANEAIKAVFLRFSRPTQRCAEFDPARDPMAYLTTTADNLAKTLLKKVAERPVLTADGVVPDRAALDTEPPEEGDPALWESPDDELLEAVRHAMRNLPPRQAQVVDMTLGGRKPEEIAEQLGISRNAVDGSLHQARGTVRGVPEVRSRIRHGHLQQGDHG